jgi:hypothetical protein
MPLIHCIYASGAAPGCTEADIAAFVRLARERNVERGITGMLVAADRSFFQILEGDADAVDELYRTIAADRRHIGVTLIIREPIARRAFELSPMGFLSMSTGDLARLMRPRPLSRPRLPLDHPWHAWLSGVDDGRAKKLLAAFAGGRWRSRPALRAELRNRQVRAA